MPLSATLFLAVACRLLLAGSLLVTGPHAAAADDPWKLLRDGGRVVLMRHAVTTPGVGDPPGMRLDDCATQRNLTEEGRRHARAIGEAFASRRIAVDRVLSSPWCRCIETARLAFQRAELAQPLSNLFGRSERAQGQVESLRSMVAAHRGSGVLVLVSHGSTIFALTGVSPDTGEMVIVSSQPGEPLTVDGRLAVAAR